MPIKLLFVNDVPAFEQNIQQQFREEIKSGEYEAIFAKSEEEVLKIIEADKQKEIQILLRYMDQKVDGVSFLKLVEILKQKSFQLNTIIISPYADPEVYRHALRENVLLFITDTYDKIEFKLLIREIINKPELINKKSTKVRFDTLTKLAKQLPSQQKEKLIHDLIGSIQQGELVRLEQELPGKLRQQIDSNERKIRQKAEMIDKLRRGDIDPDSPFQLLEGHFIEEKYIRRDGKIFGPYYYLRWRGEGKLQTKYLGRKDPRKHGLQPGESLPPSE